MAKKCPTYAGSQNGGFANPHKPKIRFCEPYFRGLVRRKAKKKRKTGKHVKKANLTFCMGKRMYINFTSVSCMVFDLNKSKSHP